MIVSLVGVGLIGAGLFRTDPVSGFPPGTPARLTASSTLGALHDGLSILTFVGIPIAALICAASSARRRRPVWAAVSVACGGLVQRVTVALGLGWLTALALRARRRTHATARR